MRPPDPELDQFLEDFGRRARTLMRGRLTCSIEKLGGVLVGSEIEQGEPMGEFDRMMRGVPCRREAMAEAKRGRRR